MNERPAGKQIALTAIAVLVLGCLIYVLYAVIATDVADDRKTAESDRQALESMHENLEQLKGLGIISDEGDSPETQAGQANEKEGWALYSPPEKDFSVLAPENVEVKVREAKVGKFREYIFRKGEAYFTVTIHTDRTEPLAGNSVEELKSDTSDFLPGSVRDISVGDMPGIEFRTQGGVGESIFREYCSPDNSRTISIQVVKDVGDGFAADEIRLFLDSFKLLP